MESVIRTPRRHGGQLRHAQAVLHPRRVRVTVRGSCMVRFEASISGVAIGLDLVWRRDIGVGSIWSDG